MALYVNGSPENINLGTDDKSKRVPVVERDPIPQHLAKFFIRGQKGPVTPQLLAPSKLPLIYGSETFNHDGKYYNHSTRLLEYITGTGASVMVQRVVPADAGIKSNVVLYIDILDDDIPNYVRDHNGNYVIDPDTNSYKVDSDNETIPGYKVKFVTEYNNSDAEKGLDAYTTKQGTFYKTDSDDNKIYSKMIPVLAVKAAYQGEFYNSVGFAIESLLGKDTDGVFMEDSKSLMYKLAIIHKEVAGNNTILRSLYNEPSVGFSLKEKVKHPTTKNRVDLEFIFDTRWYNEKNSVLPLRYNEFEGIYVYRDNIKDIISKWLTNEKQYISSTDKEWDDGITGNSLSWFDYSDDDAAVIDEEYLLTNIFTLKSSKNINMFSVIMASEASVLTPVQKEVTVSKNTPIFMNGGSDGTMTNETYEAAVVAELKKYADENAEVMDSAINPESVIYDPGFTLPTKLEMANFIGLRHDTVVAFTTHDAQLGEKDLSIVESRSIASLIKSRLKLAPESTYFGTAVARAIIVMGTGIHKSGLSKERIPLLYEVAVKTAKMMGAGNFKWDRVEAFDHGAKANLEFLVDVNPDFIPKGVEPGLYSDGLIYIKSKDRSTNYITQLQTVYEDDTSILNSWYTVNGIATVNKIADDIHREFSGTTGMSDNAFKEAVLGAIKKRLNGIFGGILTVIPEVIITKEDEQNGFSWHVTNTIYGSNMKTKMIHNTVARRLSDLA